MSKKCPSDAMAAIHETMAALHKVGSIDKQTMRRFEEACLTRVEPLSPKQIKALREREQASHRESKSSSPAGWLDMPDFNMHVLQVPEPTREHNTAHHEGDIRGLRG